jgi:NADH-quinone oxidoreductase subunit J
MENILNILKDQVKMGIFIHWVIFLTLSFITILSSWFVVTLRNIFHCALFLCLCLISIAGIYILLSAEFIAAVQVLIYAGGIVVLILFAIMLTQRIAGKVIIQTNEQKGFAALFSIALFAILCTVFLKTVFPLSKSTNVAQSTPTIGKLLITKYVLPFEIASIVLLVAMIGAIIFVKKE